MLIVVATRSAPLRKWLCKGFEAPRRCYYGYYPPHDNFGTAVVSNPSVPPEQQWRLAQELFAKIEALKEDESAAGVLEQWNSDGKQLTFKMATHIIDQLKSSSSKQRPQALEVRIETSTATPLTLAVKATKDHLLVTI